jgi:hypothetical protein
MTFHVAIIQYFQQPALLLPASYFVLPVLSLAHQPLQNEPRLFV